MVESLIGQPVNRLLAVMRPSSILEGLEFVNEGFSACCGFQVLRAESLILAG